MASREKYNLIQELELKKKELVGKKRLALVGQGSFTGGNNLMRLCMNNKHMTQHLTIEKPEFPFFFDGKENVMGENSSFYIKSDKEYEIVGIVKKYDELLKGKSKFALYFLHSKEDDSYKLVERKEVENLSENFGFGYNTEYLDQCELGDIIPVDTNIISSTSYDEYGNVSLGINGRVLNGVHPAVQDDAIILSESFANRGVINIVNEVKMNISKDTILLNRYGDEKNYQGLPNIGDMISDGICTATRTVKETRMFSDLRDAALQDINFSTDNVYYIEGDNNEVVDINVYCNRENMKLNKVNKILMQYYIDCKWFYTEVYKICKKIINSGSKKIDSEINRWMRLAINYLDTNSQWSFESDMMIEILLRRKEPIKVGRKVVGRAGNKTVTCAIWKDEWMPYLTEETATDKYGVVHPKGIVERVDMITNPLALINRTIALIPIEGSVTFILDRARKHAAKIEDFDKKVEFIFDVLSILSPKFAKDQIDLFKSLNNKEKKKYIEDCISLNYDGTLRTDNGMYARWEAFDYDQNLRDSICLLYDKYGEVFNPYHIFVPKPKWGRDIYIGQDYVGYQYMMVLKQSGEKGFSVRSAGSVSDESLPEKSHRNKAKLLWHSEKPMDSLFSIKIIILLNKNKLSIFL